MSETIHDGDLVLTPGEFGRVVGDGSGPMVVVDHDGHCAVYPIEDVEAVVGVSERDAMRERAVMAERERDRLRAELESLRSHVVQLATLSGHPLLDDVASDIGDILSGGKS